MTVSDCDFNQSTQPKADIQLKKGNIVSVMCLRVIILFMGCAFISVDVLAALTPDQRIEKIYSTYKSLNKISDDIPILVDLDEKIRKLMAEEQQYRGKKFITWNNKYKELGLYVGHWSDMLEYVDKLLLEAHKIDPNSQHRASTLYATILGKSDWRDAYGAPNINQALNYANLYPNGPFIGKTYKILATFYDDKYKLLRGLIENHPYITERLSCYKKYLTSEPYDMQMKESQTEGVKFYKLSINYYAGDEAIASRLKRDLQELENGTTEGWYWCPD
ncbi:MAG: hypothetical protein PVG18_05090 [Thioalkalispiraceae bacterium]